MPRAFAVDLLRAVLLAVAAWPMVSLLATDRPAASSTIEGVLAVGAGALLLVIVRVVTAVLFARAGARNAVASMAGGAFCGLAFGIVVTGFADIRDVSLAAAPALTIPALVIAAACLEIGVRWGHAFPALHATGSERAWTWWMLWPSLGAVALPLALRDEYPAPGIAALALAAIVTIFAHALVMGQRDHTVARGGTEAAPDGPLARAVQWLPSITATVGAATLAAVGVWAVLR